MYLIFVGLWIIHVFNNFWVLSCQNYLLPPSRLFYELPWGLFIWSLIHCKIIHSISNSNFLLWNIHLCCICYLLQEKHFFISLSILLWSSLWFGKDGDWPCISGIRVGVPECVDRSPNVRQFAPGPWVGWSLSRICWLCR